MDEAKVKYQKLEAILSASNVLKKYCNGDHDEASAVALAITDILQSMDELKRLSESTCNRGDLTPDEVEVFLQDIDSELEHIIYHIRDCHRFSYLLE